MFYAKKIANLNEEKQTSMERGMYLLYNIKLMNRLKDAYDSNTFFKTQTKVPLSELLIDQKGLAKFLNKALETRIKEALGIKTTSWLTYFGLFIVLVVVIIVVSRIYITFRDMKRNKINKSFKMGNSK